MAGFDPISGAVSGASNLLNIAGSFAASNEQEKAASSALKLQRRMYLDQQARMQPYYTAGTQSLADLQRLMADPSSLENDPSYQFRFGQGQDAIQSNLAARGGLLGGAALKKLTEYGQGFASNEFQNQFNRLAALAGIGQNAAGGMNASSQNMASMGGDLLTGMGNARASAYLGAAGAINNGLQNYMSYDLNNKYLSAMGA